MFLLLILVVGFVFTSNAKPVQNENAAPSVIRRLDSLSGFTLGSNKAIRSLPDVPRSSLDSLGDGNYLRSLDSLGGSNYLRSLDSIDKANFIRDLDTLGGANFLRALNSLGGNLRQHQPSLSGFDYRSLDSASDATMNRGESKSSSSIHPGKRLDTLSGIALGHQKRTFDEVDRTAFDGFNKRNFDEIDRSPIQGLAKRDIHNIREVL